MLHAREDYNNRIVDLQNRIPNDEPVFMVRAQDLASADTVRAWADRAEEHGSC